MCYHELAYHSHLITLSKNSETFFILSDFGLIRLFYSLHCLKRSFVQFKFRVFPIFPFTIKCKVIFRVSDRDSKQADLGRESVRYCSKSMSQYLSRARLHFLWRLQSTGLNCGWSCPDSEFWIAGFLIAENSLNEKGKKLGLGLKALNLTYIIMICILNILGWTMITLMKQSSDLDVCEYFIHFLD